MKSIDNAAEMARPGMHALCALFHPVHQSGMSIVEMERWNLDINSAYVDQRATHLLFGLQSGVFRRYAQDHQCHRTVVLLIFFENRCQYHSHSEPKIHRNALYMVTNKLFTSRV
jgi:hypothetical protein